MTAYRTCGLSARRRREGGATPPFMPYRKAASEGDLSLAARLEPGEQKAEGKDGEDDIVEPEGLRRLSDHDESRGDGDRHDDLDQRA